MADKPMTHAVLIDNGDGTHDLDLSVGFADWLVEALIETLDNSDPGTSRVRISKLRITLYSKEDK